MEEILKYFPELTTRQQAQFEALYDIYGVWNERINVISRKDFSSLYLKHVLHSLSLARVLCPAQSAEILDIGCGGGFPTVPLAIMFPETAFTAADSIGKKITVVKEVCKAAGIENVTAVNSRAEQIDGRFDYVVSRAVAPMSDLIKWSWNKIRVAAAGNIPNGILALKGGDLTEELAATGREYETFEISKWFDEEFFATKKIVFVEKR